MATVDMPLVAGVATSSDFEAVFGFAAVLVRGCLVVFKVSWSEVNFPLSDGKVGFRVRFRGLVCPRDVFHEAGGQRSAAVFVRLRTSTMRCIVVTDASI